MIPRGSRAAAPCGARCGDGVGPTGCARPADIHDGTHAQEHQRHTGGDDGEPHEHHHDPSHGRRIHGSMMPVADMSVHSGRMDLPPGSAWVYAEAMLTKVVVGVAVAGLLVIPSAPASARELPPRSITHQNSQFWSWAGPRNWVSADGAYGITISSGRRTDDDGLRLQFDCVRECCDRAGIRHGILRSAAGDAATVVAGQLAPGTVAGLGGRATAGVRLRPAVLPASSTGQWRCEWHPDARRAVLRLLLGLGSDVLLLPQHLPGGSGPECTTIPAATAVCAGVVGLLRPRGPTGSGLVRLRPGHRRTSSRTAVRPRPMYPRARPPAPMRVSPKSCAHDDHRQKGWSTVGHGFSERAVHDNSFSFRYERLGGN